ncbi:MAG: ArsR family transcriptional regulator [Candidatus Aenigmarchaeota archaeon]|nr:ArsR family transcriptional regulator [Candidatus Aenigmarchaeota archaeon]
MKGSFVEKEGETQKVYDARLVGAAGMKSLGSPLAGRIISELARQPQCAMDVARSLKENEQKIYYYLRGLEKAGIVEKSAEEQRYGMVAKIFCVVSPVVAAKLYEGGETTKEVRPLLRSRATEFMKPFIQNGKFNAKMIVGNSHPHGNYGATARDAVYIPDFAMFMGTMMNEFIPDICKIDTEVKEEDLKNNLIVIGNPKINVIAERINSNMPIYFNKEKQWAIESSISGKTYDYDNDSLILKTKNPFDEKREILFIAGIRSSALRVAIKAFIVDIEEIAAGNVHNRSVIAKVVTGIDKNGDGIIDDIKFLE